MAYNLYFRIENQNTFIKSFLKGTFIEYKIDVILLQNILLKFTCIGI